MRIEAATSVLVAGITKCPKRKKKRSAPVVPQRAVIAIVAEECLIDFRELIGQYSGENMAAAVWDTVQSFGITGRVNLILFDLCKT
jgi:hypothetical protein